MLISEVEKTSILLSFCSREPSAISIIESSEGRGVTKTLRRCLRGECSADAIEVVVATCPGNGRPSPRCCGDVDDGTVKGPRACVERAISCSRRAGVIPVAVEAGSGRS
jgi:hypothetical protein